MKTRFITILGMCGGILFLLLQFLPAFSRPHLPETMTSIPLSFPSSNRHLPAVEFVGSVWGSVSAVAVSNTTAYIGEGAALVVLDVSDPLEPVQLSRLPLPNLIEHIQVVDHLVYSVNGRSGLHIIDVQDLSKPVLLGSYDTPGAAVEVLVLDGRAYIADGNDGCILVSHSPVRRDCRGHMGSIVADTSEEPGLTRVQER